jgi:hypothetical protein
MKAELVTFLTGVTDLRNYIATLGFESQLYQIQLSADAELSPGERMLRKAQVIFQTNLVSKKQFDYNSVIVSLYGYLEQFVEALSRSFLLFLTKAIPIYSQLPTSILDRHLELTLDLLSRLKHPKYAGKISEQLLISNLHSCLSGSTKFALNIDAFTHHTSNFRTPVINEYFSSLGISNICMDIYKSKLYQDYLTSNGIPIKGSPKPHEMFPVLDDLADRRNEVAHGSASNLLALTLLKDYLEFAGAFGNAFARVIHAKTLPYQSASFGYVLGTPLDVFNHNIVAFSVDNHVLSIGDLLIAETGDSEEPFRGGPIESLQVNNKAYRRTSKKHGLQVACRVKFYAKKNHRYFHVPRNKGLFVD